MAVTSKGYAGQIQANQDWAYAQNGLGRRYWCEGAGHWRVTSVANSRQIQVAVGACGGWGVRDSSDAVQTMTLPAVATGTTWFLVCARRTWGITQQTSLVAYSVGGSPVVARQQTSPGVVDDQPLALVPVTNNVAGTPRDLRLVGGFDAINIAFDDLVRSYADWAGIQIRIGSKLWFRGISATFGYTWESTEIGIEKASGSSMFSCTKDWSMFPPGTNPAAYPGNRMLRDGNRVQYEIAVRMINSVIDTNSIGDQGDTTIGNFPRYRPDYQIPVELTCNGGLEQNESGQFGAHGTLYPSGNLAFISGPPNIYLFNSSRPQDQRVVLRARIEFIKETI